GILDPATLPVQEFISWVQYSSYANGAFQLQWREEFDGATLPAAFQVGTWASPKNLSTHNPANVTFADGIAVLSMTADNATGYTATPPADTPTDAGTGTDGAPGAKGGSSGSGCSCSAGGHGPAGRAGLIVVLLIVGLIRRRRP
ncbi:MAG TPA: MYXO-CTERM sorting domain-containing protein, partial [Polyangia bacterium]|nr:MYXO-CTERM sorting domain-containing protein [Polyangia bacterium]